MQAIKLVLLPGLDGTGVLFGPLLDALPPYIEPVVIAYPDQTPLGYDELLPRVLAQLPQQTPYVLLGESFGGPLSLRVAATRQAGLRALILSASFVTCPYAFFPAWTAHLVHPFPFRAFPRYPQIKALLGGYATRKLADLSAQALSQVAPEVFACRVREVIRVNAVRELQDCAVPVLYVQGADDHVVPASNLRAILQLKPDVESVRLPAPHMVLQTQPVMAAKAIDAFIRRIAIT